MAESLLRASYDPESKIALGPNQSKGCFALFPLTRIKCKGLISPSISDSGIELEGSVQTWEQYPMPRAQATFQSYCLIKIPMAKLFI